MLFVSTPFLVNSHLCCWILSRISFVRGCWSAFHFLCAFSLISTLEFSLISTLGLWISLMNISCIMILVVKHLALWNRESCCSWNHRNYQGSGGMLGSIFCIATIFLPAPWVITGHSTVYFVEYFLQFFGSLSHWPSGEGVDLESGRSVI